MMSHFSIHRTACGTIVLLAAAAGTAAEAQTPQSRSQTSVVQRLTDTSATANVTGRMRELKCRGKPGIAMQVHQAPSPRHPQFVTMVLRYERPRETRSFGQEGMGLVDYGRSIQFHPGSCTWGAGTYPDIPPEPGVVFFDLPRDGQPHLPGARDTSMAAAAHYPDPISLPLYLSDSNRYWVFYVDDVTNVSISFGQMGGPPAPTHASVTGSLRDASPGSATLTSARVLPGDSAARTPTVVRTPAPAPAPTAAGTVSGPLRDKSPGTATVAGARPLPTDSAARRTAAARTPTPAPADGVDRPLRDKAPATGSVSSGSALPTDTAARRTAAVRTPTPAPAGGVAGPLRGTSPAAAPSTSRVMPTDTAAKVPDDARARSPQLRRNRVYDVRTAPGPLGVRLTFKATGAGASSEIQGLLFHNPTGGIQVQFSRTKPSWDEREGQWSYPTGWNSPWAAPVRLTSEGGFEAEPFARLENGERYYYLITVHGSDAASPPGQRTGSFTADVRTQIGGLFR